MLGWRILAAGAGGGGAAPDALAAAVAVAVDAVRAIEVDFLCVVGEQGADVVIRLGCRSQYPQDVGDGGSRVLRGGDRGVVAYPFRDPRLGILELPGVYQRLLVPEWHLEVAGPAEGEGHCEGDSEGDAGFQLVPQQIREAIHALPDLGEGVAWPSVYRILPVLADYAPALDLDCQEAEERVEEKEVDFTLMPNVMRVLVREAHGVEDEPVVVQLQLHGLEERLFGIG